MSTVTVLGEMDRPRRCPHTGLTIPQCSCRVCCEALVRELVAREARRPGATVAMMGRKPSGGHDGR
jgi:hypothetical protein